MKSNTNLVIGITGRMGSGKTTVAKLLPELLTQYDNHYKIGIADEIKESLANYTGGKLETIELNKSILRPVLQVWGDIIRERLLDILKAKIDKLQSPYLLIIHDVRLVAEVKFLKENYKAVILKMERRPIDQYGHYLPNLCDGNLSSTSSVDSHRTETEVDLLTYDYFIQNNMSMDYLWKTECNGFAYWLRNRKSV